MNEMQLDRLSNGCMEIASARLNEGKRLLKAGNYNEAVCKGYETMLLGMESVLAMEGITFRESLEAPFPEGETEGLIGAFSQRYLESEMMPPEWKATRDRLLQEQKEIAFDEAYAIPKEQAGKLISQMQGFLQEMVDFLVIQNTKYAGQ